MAENKASFILYCDSFGMIKQLPDEIAGKLLKHIFAYVNDEDPKSDDILLNIAFEPIKMHLKRDLVRWEESTEQKRLNGILGNLKRWNLDLYEDVVAKKITLEIAQTIANNRKASQPDSDLSQSIAKIAVSDSVIVSVIDSVTDIKETNNINTRKLKFSQSLIPFVSVYGKDMVRDFCDYWTEPNKSNTKFKQELQKTWDTSRRLKSWNNNNFNNKGNGKSKIANTEQFKQIIEAIDTDGVRR